MQRRYLLRDLATLAIGAVAATAAFTTLPGFARDASAWVCCSNNSVGDWAGRYNSGNDFIWGGSLNEVNPKYVQGQPTPWTKTIITTNRSFRDFWKREVDPTIPDNGFDDTPFSEHYNDWAAEESHRNSK